MPVDSTNPSRPVRPPGVWPPLEKRPSLRILLAEDDDATRISLAYILESAGFQVRQARNGVEALAQAGNGVDAALLDIEMPAPDGTRTLQQLRRRPELAGMAIVMLTSHASRDRVEQCVRLGADGFVVKQKLDVDHLIEKIETAVQSRRKGPKPSGGPLPRSTADRV